MRIRNATLVDIAGIADIQVKTWRSTYLGLVPDDYLATMSTIAQQAHWRSSIARGQDFVVVAEDDSERIVGFACAGPNRDVERALTGELHQLSLYPERQGRGIGRTLVEAVVSGLLDRELTSMIVWVLGGNPFRAFYEAWHGEHASQRTIHIGGVPLLDIAYGWRDARRPLDH